MTDPMDELWTKTRASLDQAMSDLIAVPPPPPPKPFDLSGLKRLAAQVDAIRPRWDRMVCAPDVVESLRAGSSPAPSWGRPLLPLGTPVFVDEEMPVGHWEFRDGDRKVDSPCRCEFCQSGEEAS